MEIKRVGVVGCGIMGSGIAQVCAESGYRVTVLEIKSELLDKGLASISSILSRAVDKGKVTQQHKETALGRIKGTIDINDMGECDLVIEAVSEDMNVKKRVFTDLDRACPAYTILTSNTSCLSITDIATHTKRPEKVLGTHFFNPVPLMRLLEVVRPVAASDEAFGTVKEFGRSLGKTVVVSKDSPGFLTTRLATLQLLEAIRMVEEGTGTVQDIDTAMKVGYNLPMGILELGDFVGLDTTLFAAKAMYEATRDAKYAPPTLLTKLVAAGRLGRKTGKGFYEYNK